MLKRTKAGHWRRMSAKAAQLIEPEDFAKGDRRKTYKKKEKAVRAMLDMKVPAVVGSVPISATVDWPAPASEPAALRRMVDVMATSHELADVLVAVRDKVQRIADEASPMDSPAGEIMDPREHLLFLLGRAIKDARRMRSWVPSGAHTEAVVRNLTGKTFLNGYRDLAETAKK